MCMLICFLFLKIISIFSRSIERRFDSPHHKMKNKHDGIFFFPHSSLLQRRFLACYVGKDQEERKMGKSICESRFRRRGDSEENKALHSFCKKAKFLVSFKFLIISCCTSGRRKTVWDKVARFAENGFFVFSKAYLSSAHRGNIERKSIVEFWIRHDKEQYDFFPTLPLP